MAQKKSSRGIASRLKRVRLVALDVDGVLTDGAVVYVGAEELQRFSVYDGQGLVWLVREGIEIAWISGRGSRATQARARELGVRELHLQVAKKDEALAEIQERLGISVDETAAMGDDIADLALAARAGFFAAPANARAELRARADLVTRARGGEGAVRELAEAILRARGAWRALTRPTRG